MANLLCINKEIFDEIIQSDFAFDDAILFVLLEQVAAIQVCQAEAEAESTVDERMRVYSYAVTTACLLVL